jgi:hypothetical protein
VWFDLWGVRNVAGTRHFFFYLLMVANLFVVFLIAASSLPDDPESGRDLREFYSRNRQYFCGGTDICIRHRGDSCSRRLPGADRCLYR